MCSHNGVDLIAGDQFQAQPTKVQESVLKFAEIRCQLITMKCQMSNRNSSVVRWSSKSDVIKRKGAKRFGLKSGFAGLPSFRLWIGMAVFNNEVWRVTSSTGNQVFRRHWRCLHYLTNEIVHVLVGKVAEKDVPIANVAEHRSQNLTGEEWRNGHCLVAKLVIGVVITAKITAHTWDKLKIANCQLHWKSFWLKFCQ